MEYYALLDQAPSIHFEIFTLEVCSSPKSHLFHNPVTFFIGKIGKNNKMTNFKVALIQIDFYIYINITRAYVFYFQKTRFISNLLLTLVLIKNQFLLLFIYLFLYK